LIIFYACGNLAPLSLARSRSLRRSPSLSPRGATIIPQLFTRCSQFCCCGSDKMTLGRALSRVTGHGHGERSPVSTALALFAFAGDPFSLAGQQAFLLFFIFWPKNQCDRAILHSPIIPASLAQIYRKCIGTRIMFDTHN